MEPQLQHGLGNERRQFDRAPVRSSVRRPKHRDCSYPRNCSRDLSARSVTRAPGVPLLQARKVTAKRREINNVGALRQVVVHVLRGFEVVPPREITADQIIDITGMVSKKLVKIISEESVVAVSANSANTEVRSAVGVEDPLARARARGQQSKRQLLEAEGGTYSAAEVADLLDLRRQSVDKRRQKGTLIGLKHERRGYRYPKWQFTDDGIVLDGLPDVLTILRNQGPWVQASYMLNPNKRLDGERPLDLLRSGQTERVREAAMNYGEQTAI